MLYEMIGIVSSKPRLRLSSLQAFPFRETEIHPVTPAQPQPPQQLH
jgi:hypothetical protein